MSMIQSVRGRCVTRDTEVAADVHAHAGGAGVRELGGHEICGQTLADPAEVDRGAGRERDRHRPSRR